MNILLLEDDPKMAAEVRHFLESEGYGCHTVHDGQEVFNDAAGRQYNLYILDINVPGMSGVEVCKKIRLHDTYTPVLMLTAYGGVADKVAALDNGADDYLVKPFHLDELLARVKALLRRSGKQTASDKKMVIGDLEIDSTEMKVRRGPREIALTPKEYRLLEVLALAEGKVVSKQAIAEQVWNINFETGTNTIEVYISFLRNKIDKGFDTQLIHTRAGYGYYLKRSK